MQISTKGRYALRLMLDLAVHNTGELVKIKDISARENISEKYLEQIISSLKKAGYVKSLRGAQGGYMLAREPETYTVGTILRLTEGSMKPVACLEDEPNQCSCGVQSHIREHFDCFKNFHLFVLHSFYNQE